MNTPIPLAWLRRWAETDHDRTAIVTAGGEVSYGQLTDMVDARSAVIASGVSDREVVSVPARLDLTSVVELFATMAVGGVPVPVVAGTRIDGATAPAGDCIVINTSGSTGAPRLVRITENNIAAAVAASRRRLGNGESDRWLLTLPIHHIGGLSVLWRSFEVGGSVAMAPFDPDLPKFIERTAPTMASMVPTMVHRMLKAFPSQLAAIDRLLIGGARMAPSLRDRAEQAGLSFHLTYGATEATSQIATSPLSDPTRLIPIDAVTVSVVDDEGVAVSAGDQGHVQVDGAVVSPGYLASEPRRGPHLTGDMGSLNESGVLTILGRSDDMVVSGGENVYLDKVADAIRGFDGVEDVALIGVEDIEWGTAVAAVVVSSRPDGALTDMARSVLAGHERPKVWIHVDEIPRLANHKHDRSRIRELVEERR